MKNGKTRVQADIASATPAVAKEIGEKSGNSRSIAPAYLSSRFIKKDGGIYKKSIDEDKPDLWVSSLVDPIAETVDEDNRWGIYVLWIDRNGRQRKEVFERALIVGECGELRSQLAAGGVTFNHDRNAKQAFGEYMNLAQTDARARVVSRTGWHIVGGKRIMVLPDEIIGKAKEQVILKTVSREPSLFNQSGTLEQWRNEIGIPCMGNSRLVLAVCIANAAALLDIVGEDGGGINLVGASRTGKTTAALVAASVGGGDPANGGARGFVRTWRTTSNATEGVAATHSDCPFVIDELGQADPRDVGNTAYMISSGLAKARADRGGGLRAQLRFRGLFISTGELGLAAKIAEAGPNTKTFAGMEVRLVDLQADPGKRMGLFEDIHGAPSVATFVQALRDATAKYYGTPFRAFVHHIMAQLAARPEFADELRQQVDDLVSRWLTPLGAAGGQVRSVARRFALIAIAGRLGTDAGITGWPDDEAEISAHACLQSWLAERGTLGAREDADAIRQLRDFISRHGSHRFEDWREPARDDASQSGSTEPPSERFRTGNRAGWRRWDAAASVWDYLVTAQGMGEALEGLQIKAAVKILVDAGHIAPAKDGRSQQSLRVPGAGRQRLYVVKASIISARPADAPGTLDEQDVPLSSGDEWTPT